MATPSSSPLVTEAPSRGRLAELIHRATTDGPVARLVSVHQDPVAERFELGFWDLPPGAGHPVDPLVGFVAPQRWCAVGLVTSGRMRHLDRVDQIAQPTLATVLVHRDGTAASVVGAPAGSERMIEDPPVGLVADVLNRVLGRPTPPPEEPTGTMVELTWLDRLAGGLLHPRGRVRSWRWMADRHPLRGGGPVPSPEELAARTAAYSEQRTWADVRFFGAEQELPAARFGPPDGTTALAATWFDDGSLSRWLLSTLPPADALVPDLLAVLPDHVGADLLTALGEVDAA
jgi:hypothetical protein